MNSAIIIDPEKKCYAVGVILDGMATEKGSASLGGARYNSAARYVDSQRCLCLAVVVSEDGMVSIIYQNKDKNFN